MTHSVHSLSLSTGGRVEPPTKFSKWGGRGRGLDRTLIFREVTFLRGGCKFYIIK